MIGNKFESLTTVSHIIDEESHRACGYDSNDEACKPELVDCDAVSCEHSGKNVKSGRKPSHGLSKSPVYRHWIAMKGRCFNPNDTGYEHYKVRGISAHQDFKESFEAFYKEIGEKPEGKGWSVGRIDNSGWYTYGNIRWETKAQQARNHSKNKNNTSGKTGVGLYVKNRQHGREFWQASWDDEQGRKTKSFSCTKYGYDAAKQMAIDYRNKMIEELNSRGFEYAESHGSS